MDGWIDSFFITHLYTSSRVAAYRSRVRSLAPYLEFVSEPPIESPYSESLNRTHTRTPSLQTRLAPTATCIILFDVNEISVRNGRQRHARTWLPGTGTSRRTRRIIDASIIIKTRSFSVSNAIQIARDRQRERERRKEKGRERER